MDNVFTNEYWGILKVLEIKVDCKTKGNRSDNREIAYFALLIERKLNYSLIFKG